MSSQSQIDANRKNAQKSTGPRTAEGKEVAAQNATKHGLRAKRNVIKTESHDEFVLFRDEMIADISPDGAMEEMLAERIVSLSWRLKRAEHFQNAVIDALIEHGLQGASFDFGWSTNSRKKACEDAAAGNMDALLGIVIDYDFSNSKTLDMLLSYERRIESSLYRAIAELKKARQAKNAENRIQDKEYRTQNTENRMFQVSSENNTCTNEPNLPTFGGKSEYLSSKSEILKDKTIMELNLENQSQTCDSVLVARDSSSEGGLIINEAQDCTNEANSMEEDTSQETESDNSIEENANIQASRENINGTNEANFTGSPVCRECGGIPSSD